MGISRLCKLIPGFLTGYLFILLCMTHIADSIKGPMCLSCQNIPFPRDCDKIIQCTENEKCGAQSFITGSANALYNVGCSSRCSAKRSSTDQKRQITVCDECCEGDYCNRDLCGFTAGPDLTNRTYCLKCDDVLDPTQCEKTVLCGPEEICYTEHIKRNGEFRYRMGCIRKQSCAADPGAPLIGRRKRLLIDADVQIDSYCNRCCMDKTGNSGNCNRKLCNNQEPVPSNVQELVLLTPPVRTDSCVDLTETSCKVLKIEDPTVCNIPGIAHYACRKTCGSCVATVSPGSALPASDCFYQSRSYQGAYDTTVTGAKCLDWSSVFHQNSMVSMFPDTSLKAAENRCRDPDGRGHPWCFTSNKNDWEYCPVPYCEQCYYDGQSQLFDGYKNTDVNNTACQPWATAPIALPDSFFVDGSKAAAKNYCRNPFPTSTNGGQASISAPLCYTVNGFINCGVPKCTESCHDSPTTNCSLVKTYVCNNEYTSVTLCPKTCEKCGFGLLPGKLVVPPASVCEDNPAANCEALQNLICPDPEGARNLCPRTCKRCNEVGPFTTSMTTGSTVPVQVSTSTAMPVGHWLEWGSYTCQIKTGACLMTRIRQCSVQSACTTGVSYGVELCTIEQCPDEIKQLNAQLTTPSTPAPTTSTPTTIPTVISTVPLDTCRDSGKYNCTLIKDAACNDNDFKRECNKTCDLCGCRDALNCQSTNQLNPFCTEPDLAQKYCRNTCNKCDLPEIPITLNTCGDPVSNEDVCKLLQEEICLCEDPELIQLCPNYCGQRCGPVAQCKTTLSMSGRSIQNKAELVGQLLRSGI